MIHTDGIRTIAMLASDPLLEAIYRDRDPGDETSYDPEVEAEEASK